MGQGKRAESRCRYLTRNIAQTKGWNIQHPSKGGNFLEEQEITDYFGDFGLNKDKPDFVVCKDYTPLIVVEAKNDEKKIKEAVSEAIEYANSINKYGKFFVKIIVGVAGEEDNGYIFETRYLDKDEWVPLTSRGFALTSFPSVFEIENAISSNNGTTEVSVPKTSDYIETAIELSKILRSAKIEPSLRPKVLGAVITALYQGEIELGNKNELDSINLLVEEAIKSTDHFSEDKKKQLIEALKLPNADYSRLAPKMGKIVFILKNLNIKSILQTDTDFLGLLYEAFIRYGYDNNSLGIVFTPRHITRFCADLINVSAKDKVIDVACGSGGFLVAAFDRMVKDAKKTKIPFEIIRESLYGFDTNPTVWSLAALNMFFRGDGKSHIENESCFNENSKQNVKGKFSKALINPPFSQEGEPEKDFINVALDSLQTMGELAVVVKSGIFADEDNALWRKEFVKHHTILGMISLPGDLFYPTAVDTTIMIVSAHRPLTPSDRVFMAKIWNDGYKKLKGKRVETEGSQLSDILDAFKKFRDGIEIKSNLITYIDGINLFDGNEFSPEQYLVQPALTQYEIQKFQNDVIESVLKASVCISGLADEVIKDFTKTWSTLPQMPCIDRGKIEDFFEIKTGKSTGESNYSDGICPYISSGDPLNSIVRLVSDVDEEIYSDGGITVTCFGRASVQPWRFMARGNGGSAVRVLIPKYKMTFSQLVWFAAQINIQRWRFFYGRMAILKRLKKLEIMTPPLNTKDIEISDKVINISNYFNSILK